MPPDRKRRIVGISHLRGYCQCGCGEKAPVATSTDTRRDVVKGQQMRFIRGHNRRGETAPFDPAAIEARFWSKVERKGADECWPWIGGSSHEYGYGIFCVRKLVQTGAHRFSYELAGNDIPTGWHVHHRCENPPCVNPKHLVALPAGTHALIGGSPPARLARQTHCKRGHPLSGDNLYVTPSGYRDCRTCKAAALVRSRERRAKA